MSSFRLLKGLAKSLVMLAGVTQPVALFGSAPVWMRTSQTQSTQASPQSSSPQTSQNAQGSQGDLTGVSLESLMSMEVTSVSRKEQKLSEVAAAVFVITQEDIRNSGATNIPDLLRMVPGIDVAQINGSTWAIGSRGFNQQFSNKLLVMIDGRIVYTPNFAGVYWDVQDVPLEDIDRIEVIRGPGGTIWGANAVNGVISIFTKKASATKGTLVEAAGGTVHSESSTVQHGGSFGKGTDYRVFTKFFNESPLLDLTGQSGDDGWHMLRTGVRTDSKLSAKDSLTLEGDLYTGREGELGFFLPSVTAPTLIGIPEEIGLGGGSFVSVWNHTYSPQSDSRLQVSYNRYRRDDPLEPETRDTLYVDYQQHFQWKKHHDLVWGAGYSFTADQIGGSFTVSFNPPSRTLQVINIFAQDEIELVPDRLFLTIGTKVEHNDYTGFGVMPDIRASWLPSKRHMFWAAVSRALRSPSRNDTNLIVNLGAVPGPGGIPILERFFGNPNFQNERLIAYEAGYRMAIASHLSLDLAAYYNDYNNLQSTEPSLTFFEPSPPPPHQVESVMYQNLMYGEAHGVEAAATWKPWDWWSVSAAFTFANEHMHAMPGSLDTLTGPFVEGNSPDHMAQVRSHMRLGKKVDWDANTYFVDQLTGQGSGTGNVTIPAYTRLDTGITWRIGEGLFLSAFGQNLLRDHHVEFEDIFGSMQSGQMKRSAYVKFTWRF